MAAQLRSLVLRQKAWLRRASLLGETRPSILRADMDALNMTELNDVPTVRPMRQDARRAAMAHDRFCAARYLVTSPCWNRPLCLQPAEEGAGGARVMIEDGFFEKFEVDEASQLARTARRRVCGQWAGHGVCRPFPHQETADAAMPHQTQDL